MLLDNSINIGDASFAGTLTTVSGTVRLEGSFVTKIDVKVLVTQKPSEQPKDIEGSPEELVGFTPYAGQDVGDVKKGQDAAQISMHALDPETKKTLLPQLDELSEEMKQLLKDNPDFFRRDDALAKYWGVRNSANEKETDKLRGQYLDATTRCYNAGFLHKCERLKIYCKDGRTATYWFKLPEAYLMSDEKVDEMRYNSIHQRVSKDAITIQSEILHWGQKMTLLRNSVEDVRALAAAFASRISSDSSEIGDWYNRRQALTGPPGINQTGAFRPTFAHIIQEMQDEEFNLLLEKDADRILAMGPQEIADRWGFQAMMAAELETEYLLMSGGQNPLPAPKPPFKERMKTGAQWVWQKAKDKGKNPKFWANMVKSLLHYASAIFMVYQLKTNWGNMKAAEIGMIISYFTAFGLAMLGDAAKSTFRFIWVRINPGWWKSKIGSVVGWLSNAAIEGGASGWARFGYALVGNLKNTLRIVGLVGLCFSLVTCYDEMNKTRDGLETNDEQKRLIFATIQFVLTLIEAVIVTFEIVFEMLGMVTAGVFCGALGAILGTLGFFVAVMYILLAMPNPDDEAKKFLRAFAKPIGSYDENQSADPADEPGVQLTPPEKKNHGRWPPTFPHITTAFASWCLILASTFRFARDEAIFGPSPGGRQKYSNS
ncbi:hypothetical protein QBC33DRAFT_563314 [Phialemonium atrogriseum]|uniref:Uncharacterized protein n=1 Tax=Phialemonium atrogriseum TaxID=1093897 RepID=A0AAJ0BRV5_9PEZI|nr:uncharacterized protein QBC33DRAFT_563314 [Phialemonium atrogriseum]KAK1762902.1 hypothetical protein QBC33DRAFT_563314 [Phialemonium atrogriseum]